MIDFGQTVRGPEIPGRASLSLPTHVGILRLVDTNIYFSRPILLYENIRTSSSALPRKERRTP